MRLNQVTVPARDIPASVAFYKALGLVQIVDAPHYARFEMPDCEATFSVLAEEGLAPGVEIFFEVDDVDAAVAALKAKGIQFEHEPEDQTWLWREARLFDPAGNRLVIYHAGDNRRAPPWRVEPASD